MFATNMNAAGKDFSRQAVALYSQKRAYKNLNFKNLLG